MIDTKELPFKSSGSLYEVMKVRCKFDPFITPIKETLFGSLGADHIVTGDLSKLNRFRTIQATAENFPRDAIARVRFVMATVAKTEAITGRTANNRELNRLLPRPYHFLHQPK